MMHGRGEVRLRHSSGEAGEQSGAIRCGAGGAKGGGPRGTRASKARAGHRAGEACHRRWSAYGKQQGKGRRRRFTALLHHHQRRCTRTAFFALKREAAPGVDGLTWQDYEADLDRRLDDLQTGSSGSVPGATITPDGTFRRRTADSARWRLPHWRTRSSSGRPLRC